MSEKEFYQDLCMKAVNQSIGRVIRHIKDYACILLADARYSNSTIETKLPQWIRSSIVKVEGFNDVFSKTTSFFMGTQ